MRWVIRGLLAVCMVVLVAGCGFGGLSGDGLAIRPSDKIVTEQRAVEPFDGIDFRAFGLVELVQGTPASVVLEGPDNLVPHLVTRVSAGRLIIETDRSLRLVGTTSPKMIFRITVPGLRAVSVSGAGDVQMASLATDNLDVSLGGAGRIQIGALQADTVSMTLKGLGDIEVAGRARQAIVSLPGAGNLDAGGLQVSTAEVTLQGLGNATVWVTEQLTGRTSGAGSVSYYGTPQVDTNSTGLGSFRSLGPKGIEGEARVTACERVNV